MVRVKTTSSIPNISPPPLAQSQDLLYARQDIPTTIEELVGSDHNKEHSSRKELYKLLCDVVAENKALKNTIKDNNQDLHAQIKQMEEWSEKSTTAGKIKWTASVITTSHQQQEETKPENVAISEADRINSPGEERLADLTRRLEASEAEAQRMADALEQMVAQKTALERDVTSLQSDNERMLTNNEALSGEKWELAAANADLQNRLQTAYMQGVPDTLMQEEVRKLHMSLTDERKVTEKLSRNLELEKRRSESLEQKAKSAFRRSGATGNSGLLPEELRQRDELLVDSMEKYRVQCERLTASLQECEEKLAGFEIQEDYHVADLRKELTNIRRLLTDERRRSSSESQKLCDVQALFGQVLKNYNESVEHLKHIQHEKKNKHSHHHDDSSDSSHSSGGSSTAKLESLNNKLMQAQEDIRDERRRAEQLADKLRNCQADIEALPLLRAQVEVYQSDFNAEREAREKIAGEKADLLQEIDRLKAEPGNLAPRHQQNEQQPAVTTTRQRVPVEIATGAVRDAIHHLAENTRHNEEPIPPAHNKGEKKNFTCPKCNKSFALLTLLQNHVNACLDMDD